MWQLYKLLKINKEKLKEYLADELDTILNTVSQEEYLKALSLLYNYKLEFIKLTPIDSILLLIDGLSANKFFDFCATMEGLNGSS